MDGPGLEPIGIDFYERMGARHFKNGCLIVMERASMKSLMGS